MVAMETLWILSHGMRQVRSAGLDDANLWIAVARPFLGPEGFGDRVVKSSLFAFDAKGASEPRGQGRFRSPAYVELTALPSYLLCQLAALRFIVSARATDWSAAVAAAIVSHPACSSN